MTEQLGVTRMRERMAAALQIEDRGEVRLTGAGSLDSRYPVSELATASIATVALAASELCGDLGFRRPPGVVDRGLADAWFGPALRPVGWSLPSPWDAIAGDYRTADGWIRLHTNAPHHRLAALRVLGVPGLPDDVSAAVAGWTGDDLESAVVTEGGCAAVLRRPAEWAAHPQGAAVSREPLVAIEKTDRESGETGWRPEPARPLGGLRVLDLTRVLAGPTATRMLAALGAEVLRIDPPGWDEPALVPDMTVGKRAASLDAGDPEGLARLVDLLAAADVIVHGYRADALERLGLGEAVRRRVRPGLVDVSLDAYGHTGPWATRRGFDSLVQMSSGIAHGGEGRPTPLPVQGLDYATGYLMAAAVLAGLGQRVLVGRGTRARLSLARTAIELEAALAYPRDPVQPAREFRRTELATPWGPAELLPPPFDLEGVRVGFDRGPSELGSEPAAW
jgi:crotonobetainyl-CoA:carnitine CoA-transferase CaiB-like acyl-CoA transferase